MKYIQNLLITPIVISETNNKRKENETQLRKIGIDPVTKTSSNYSKDPYNRFNRKKKIIVTGVKHRKNPLRLQLFLVQGFTQIQKHNTNLYEKGVRYTCL